MSDASQVVEDAIKILSTAQGLTSEVAREKAKTAARELLEAIIEDAGQAKTPPEEEDE